MLRFWTIYIVHRVSTGLIVAWMMMASSLATAQSNDDIKLWLQWLGVTGAMGQADRIINQEIAQLSKRGVIAEKSLQVLGQKLSKHTGSKVMTASVTSFVIKNFPKSHGSLAQTLRDPLMVRARNFDVALEMTGAFNKFKSFDNRRLSDPLSDKRVTLMRQLDKAQRTSQIAALIQTELNVTTSQLVAKTTGSKWVASDPEWLMLQKQQRERYMSDVVTRLHLFSYRFMKDKELEGYVKLMESSGVQLMLDTALQGVQESLLTARLNAIQ